MAHENLRFNLILRNGNTPTSNSQSSYNPIYTDQYYGTHFGLFADFKPKDTNEVYNKEFEVGKIAMKLQNYSGAVTLGISSIISLEIKDAEEEFIVKDFSTGRLIELSVCLQALNNSFEKSVDLAQEQKSFTFKEGDILNVKVFIKPIDSELSGIDDENRNTNSLFVDENYMIRDGEEINVLDKNDLRDAIKTMESTGFSIIPKDTSSFTSEKIDSINRLKDILEILGGADRRCKLRNSDIYIL